MPGTKAGGAKAAATNRRKYGDDFYRGIGAKGGKNGHTGGFASEKVGADGLTGRERAKKVGVIGGRRSRKGSRNRTKTEQEIEMPVDNTCANKKHGTGLWRAWRRER